MAKSAGSRALAQRLAPRRDDFFEARDSPGFIRVEPELQQQAEDLRATRAHSMTEQARLVGERAFCVPRLEPLDVTRTDRPACRMFRAAAEEHLRNSRSKTACLSRTCVSLVSNHIQRRLTSVSPRVRVCVVIEQPRSQALPQASCRPVERGPAMRIGRVNERRMRIESRNHRSLVATFEGRAKLDRLVFFNHRER